MGESPNRPVRSLQNERPMAAQNPMSFNRGTPGKNVWNQQISLAERLRSAEDVKSTVASQKIRAPPGLTLNSGSESSLSDLASTASSSHRTSRVEEDFDPLQLLGYDLMYAIEDSINDNIQ